MGYHGEKPKRKPKAAQNGATSNDVAPFLRKAADWRGYVNAEIEEVHKAQFESFAGDTTLVAEMASTVLCRGYKFSVVQVDDEETVRVTCTAGFSGMPDHGLAVSAWAESIWDGIASVTFIVAVLAQFDLSVWASPADRKRKRTF